ncbi:uncharacterized protein LOC122310218 [Carya illinoinensis]|uniref:uncharacterized protein LOC122310218 n=1 Tax=Carya illinoinensis TaxID=32201 RepID=UPI001C71A444|nr:uncharacterized protein LOC122310218 [Carya illinoinensis]
MDPTHKTVRQKIRLFSAEKYATINEEVKRLLATGFIKKAHYPEWLSNVVLVKKANGKWRMCMDFTNLNKACPKDSFPLPCIDVIVDATVGHRVVLLSSSIVQIEECRGYLPKADGGLGMHLQSPDGKEVTYKLACTTSGMKEVPFPWQVERRIIKIPTIGKEVGVLGSNIPVWANGVVEYLYERKLPEEKEEARRVRRKVARFMFIDGVLYERGFSTLLL